MTDTTDTAAETRRLTARIDRLESYWLRTWCAITGVLIVLGMVVPFMTGDVDVGSDDETSVSVLSAVVAFVQSSDGDGEDAAFGTVMAIGFVGLNVVLVAMLVMLGSIGGRRGTSRTVTTAKVLRVLAFIGASVPTILGLAWLANDEEDGSAGPGPILLLAGLVAYSVLLAPRVRELWLVPVVPWTKASASRQAASVRSSPGGR